MAKIKASNTPVPIGIDLNDRRLYKAAGICAWGLPLMLVIEVVLGVSVGSLPGSSGLAWLTFVNAKSGTWSAIIYVTLIADVLFLVAYSALYVALRPVNRGLMLIATVLAILGTVLDEAIANANSGSLLTLGSQYSGAGTAAQRAADVAAADYAASMLSSQLEGFFIFVVPGIALVLIGIVMLRSPFGRRTAYVGIAAGVFDLVQITGWDLSALLTIVLEAVFFALVGRTLYSRYARPAAVVPAEPELTEDPLSV